MGASYSVAAIVFRLVQGHVGAVDQSPDAKVFIPKSYAQANRDGEISDGCVNRSVRHASAHTLRQNFRLVIRLRQKEHELFASIPPHNVGGADGLPEPPGDFSDNLIPHRVAARVVDALEMVDVGHYGSQWPLVPLGGVELLLG